MSYFKIKGVLPPVITPFLENGKIDYEGFATNIEKWNEIDLAGYLILGSNSETPYINEDEKLELIKIAVEKVNNNKIIMAGTGLESTQSTIELTNKAAKLGAHCALLLTPNYYGSDMGDNAQIAYFTEIADSVDIPILIYNVTKFTHVNISTNAVSVLSKHPNIIGMKDSSGDIAQMIRFMNSGISEEFNLLTGTASAWYPALSIGVEASIMALANCCPAECVEIQKLFENGNYKKSLELYKRVFPVNDAVTAKFGVPGLKYACESLGFRGGKCRKPLLDLNTIDAEKIDGILNNANIF